MKILPQPTFCIASIINKYFKILFVKSWTSYDRRTAGLKKLRYEKGLIDER